MKTQYQIAKPIIKWFDFWADYETNDINGIDLQVEDLQADSSYGERVFDSTVESRLDRIGDYIYDEWACGIESGYFEGEEIYFNKIKRLYDRIYRKLFGKGYSLYA